MHRPRLATLACAVLLGSCTSTTAPDPSESALALEQPLPAPGQSALRAGTIRLYEDPLLVEVPPLAETGVPFTVSVTTYGGGCIGEDVTIVRVDGSRADVVPYQRVYRPAANEACTAELRVTKRQATVMFGVAGVYTVRVIGREQPGDTLIQEERQVVVR